MHPFGWSLTDEDRIRTPRVTASAKQWPFIGKRLMPLESSMFLCEARAGVCISTQICVSVSCDVPRTYAPQEPHAFLFAPQEPHAFLFAPQEPHAFLFAPQEPHAFLFAPQEPPCVPFRATRAHKFLFVTCIRT